MDEFSPEKYLVLKAGSGPREREVRKKWVLNAGKLGLDAVIACGIFDKILNMSRKRQKENLRIKVAYQGKPGAFGEIAASKIGEPVPCRTLKDVMKKVRKGYYGVLPVENTCTGKIKESMEILKKSNVNVISRITIPVVHCLIAKKNILVKNIKKIYAHPQALLQCKKYLSKLDCRLIPYYDGAGAYQKVLADGRAALIASKNAAKEYNLKILKMGIQDLKNNKTSFLVIAREGDGCYER